MCGLLGVSTSGYYAWLKRPPSSRTQQEPRLEAEGLVAHQRTRETFGAERLQKDLTRMRGKPRRMRLETPLRLFTRAESATFGG